MPMHVLFGGHTSTGYQELDECRAIGSWEGQPEVKIGLFVCLLVCV